MLARRRPSVPFHDLYLRHTVTPEGLQYGDDALPWHMIGVVRHDETVVDVFERGAASPCWRIPVPALVNPRLFVEMLRHTP
jgi:hypothetical protein